MRVDGKQLAEAFLNDLTLLVQSLKEKNIVPHLVVMLVGNDPASEAYVRQKQLKGEAIGMMVSVKRYEASVTTEQLLKEITAYNNDPLVHGIIVQQPLPQHIDASLLIAATNQQKDVDGFQKDSAFTPPIAEGVEEILKFIFHEIASLRPASTQRDEQAQGKLPRNDNEFLSWLQSKNVVIIGKGETGGMPIIQKMQKLGVTPSIIDSKTADPVALKKQADIIISCVGKPRVVAAEEIKKGVILLSIGMFRAEDGKLHGDYEEGEIKGVASYYTPVPGGVGPMNVAMLLRNVIEAAGINRG